MLIQITKTVRVEHCDATGQESFFRAKKGDCYPVEGIAGQESDLTYFYLSVPRIVMGVPTGAWRVAPPQPERLKWAEDSPYYDYRRAAAYLGEKVKTLQNAKVAGKLRPVQGGAGVSFLREELDRYKRGKNRC